MSNQPVNHSQQWRQYNQLMCHMVRHSLQLHIGIFPVSEPGTEMFYPGEIDIILLKQFCKRSDACVAAGANKKLNYRKGPKKNNVRSTQMINIQRNVAEHPGEHVKEHWVEKTENCDEKKKFHRMKNIKNKKSIFLHSV